LPRQAPRLRPPPLAPDQRAAARPTPNVPALRPPAERPRPPPGRPEPGDAERHEPGHARGGLHLLPRKDACGLPAEAPHDEQPRGPPLIGPPRDRLGGSRETASETRLGSTPAAPRLRGLRLWSRR